MKNLLFVFAFVGAACILGTSCSSSEKKCCSASDSTKIEKKLPQYDNAFFYDSTGLFLPDKAKQAYTELLQYHGLPVYPEKMKNMWVSDYGTGHFAQLGLGAIVFDNNEKDKYMLMDLLMLPNQMLPEHWHEATTRNPVKMEGWLIRAGLSHVFGEGEDNMASTPEVVIPKCHLDGTVTVKHQDVATPGMLIRLSAPKAKHFQFAGPEGAVITEVGNVHDGLGCFHSDKKINDNYLSQQK